MKKRKAIFLDRDGTLNRDVGYVTHLDDYELLPRAGAAVKKINDTGFLAVLVTNQAGVARGYFEESMIGKVHGKLQKGLELENANLDAIYYCPHVSNGADKTFSKDCEMRKPKPGMLLKAAHELDVDLTQSFMIGDKFSDLECGWSAGCQSALVLTGYGRGEFETNSEKWLRQPDFVAEDVYHAVELIFS
ncbi:MAG: HAD family hydrolase [Nitrospinota bacterium]|nr:HAD family hydrolase [Nitrospinota bacterium]